MTVLFRKGDICTIEVIVTSSFNETTVCVKPVDGYESIYLKPRELTMLRPTFEVGDKVQWTTAADGMGPAYTGHVLAIADDHLWVDRGGGIYATVWVSKAMRIDPDPEPKAVVEPAPIYTTVSTVCAPAAVSPSDIEGMV